MTPLTTKAAEIRAGLVDRLREHVRSRGGLSRDAETGEIVLPNGAWAMMLEAADLIEQQAAELAEARADLDQIADMHIPDCPAHFTGDEAEWAQRHVATLRRIARGSGKPMEQGE